MRLLSTLCPVQHSGVQRLDSVYRIRNFSLKLNNFYEQNEGLCLGKIFLVFFKFFQNYVLAASQNSYL